MQQKTRRVPRQAVVQRPERHASAAAKADMVVAPGTRVLGAGGPVVGALPHSGSGPRHAAPAAALPRRLCSCRAGALRGAPLLKVRCRARAAPSAPHAEAVRAGLTGPGPRAQAGPGRCNAAQRRPRGAWQVVRAEADFYDTLGVPKNADKKAIKSAYRCAARRGGHGM